MVARRPPEAKPSSALASVFARRLLRFAERYGIARADALSALGLDEATLVDPLGRVDARPYLALFGDVVRRADDPGLPIAIAQTMRLADYGVHAMLGMSSGSLHEGLKSMARFAAIHSTSGHWSYETSSGTASLTWIREGARDLGMRTANESAVAELLLLIRTMASGEIVPIDVSFTHRAPRDDGAHRALFDVVPRWGALRDGFVLPLHALEQPSLPLDPILAPVLEARAAAVLAQLGEDVGPTRRRVHTLILAALPEGMPAIGAVASALRMPERTLRRRLADEGTSFRDAVDVARRDLALAFLAEPGARVTEVAVRVGFQDAASFTRAFRRWTGEAPSAYANRTQPEEKRRAGVEKRPARSSPR